MMVLPSPVDDQVPFLFPRWTLDQLGRAEAGLRAEISAAIDALPSDAGESEDPHDFQLWLFDFIQRLPTAHTQGGQ